MTHVDVNYGDGEEGDEQLMFVTSRGVEGLGNSECLELMGGVGGDQTGEMDFTVHPYQPLQARAQKQPHKPLLYLPLTAHGFCLPPPPKEI